MAEDWENCDFEIKKEEDVQVKVEVAEKSKEKEKKEIFSQKRTCKELTLI